jgi:type VI secretion system protein ImpL
VVTDPAALDKFVSKDNEPYVGGLLALQGAVEQVGNMPAAVDTAGAMLVAQTGQQALMQAAQAKVAARQLAQKFAVDTAAGQVGPAVAALLVAPVEAAEAVLRGVAATRPPPGRRVAAAPGGGAAAAAGAPAAPAAPAPKADAASLAQINDRGKALCAALTPVLAKFPFNPEARDEATVAEVNAIFAPGTGTLWALQQEKLVGVLDKQGERWVPVAGSPVAVSAPFVAFFNRAARVSDALYGGAAEPHVVFTAQALGGRAVALAHGSQVARFGKDAAPAQFAWPSATGREARLEVDYRSLVVRGKTATVARASGEWAMFRLMAQAAKWDGANGSYRAEWTGGGQGPVAMQVTFASGAPVMQRGWLGGMACASQVTR